MATRDITLDVTIRARTADAVKAEAALKRIDEQAKHAGRSMEGMTGDAKILNAEIKRSEQTIKDLDRVLLEFGNDKSVRSRIRSERSWLNELRRLEKDLTPSGGQLGASVTDDFAAQLSGAFSGEGGMPGLGPAVVGGILEAVVLAAPSIGGILAGALAGATGTGAMAAGILSAAKDAQVQSAAKQFGHDISAEFFGGGSAFVQPTIEALDILRKAFADMHVGDALAKMAPTVTVIAGGVAELGKELMPGLNRALDRMGPLADAAADGFAQTGAALGEFLDDVTSSKGTVEGLRTLFSLVNGTVIVLGKSLEGLSNVFHRTNAALAGAFGGLEDVFAAVGLDHLAELAGRANDGLERLTGTGESIHGMFRSLSTEAIDPFTGYLHHAWEEQQRLREETEATRKSLVDYFDTLRGMDDANIAWEQALDNLTESIKENGTSLDITTEKGRNNARAILEGIDAAKRQYEQGKITQAQYDQEIQKLIEIGVKAGMSRKALEDLAGKYMVEIVVNAFVPAVKGAIGLVSSAMQNIFSGGGGPTTSTNRHESFASGGVTPAFAPFEVHSGEMLWSNREHYVSTAAQTKALASGGGSSTQQVVEFRVTGAADSAVAQLIHALQRKGALQIFSSAIVTR